MRMPISSLCTFSRNGFTASVCKIILSRQAYPLICTSVCAAHTIFQSCLLRPFQIHIGRGWSRDIRVTSCRLRMQSPVTVYIPPEPSTFHMRLRLQWWRMRVGPCVLCAVALRRVHNVRQGWLWLWQVFCSRCLTVLLVESVVQCLANHFRNADYDSCSLRGAQASFLQYWIIYL
jgi:hypothetical protein